MENRTEASVQKVAGAQPARPYAFSRKVFAEGMRDGVPIALGYFAVSFSLGIAARKAGLFPVSVLCCAVVFVLELFLVH